MVIVRRVHGLWRRLRSQQGRLRLINRHLLATLKEASVQVALRREILKIEAAYVVVALGRLEHEPSALKALLTMLRVVHGLVRRLAHHFSTQKRQRLLQRLDHVSSVIIITHIIMVDVFRCHVYVCVSICARRFRVSQLSTQLTFMSIVIVRVNALWSLRNGAIVVQELSFILVYLAQRACRHPLRLIVSQSGQNSVSDAISGRFLFNRLVRAEKERVSIVGLNVLIIDITDCHQVRDRRVGLFAL